PRAGVGRAVGRGPDRGQGPRGRADRGRLGAAVRGSGGGAEGARGAGVRRVSGGWTVADVAQATRGDVVGATGRDHAPDSGRAVTGAALDSRRMARGQVFVALRGAHADGHAFIADAFGRGAATALCARTEEGAVAERCRAAAPPLAPDTPLVLVDDPEAALRAWARARRDGWSGELIGLTGSNGKTTTKEMLAAI